MSKAVGQSVSIDSIKFICKISSVANEPRVECELGGNLQALFGFPLREEGRQRTTGPPPDQSQEHKMLEVMLLVWAFGLVLLLITKRWFWFFVFLVGGFASAFVALVSILLHFHITAVEFFFLTIICWGIVYLIAPK